MNNYKITGLVLALLFLCGCNTVEGLGKDIKGAGEVISTTAGDVKEKINKAD